jgi:eukaryotic translation initiation factor 2C
MMERVLGGFIELNKILPRRVIFFQDGVSEGEYNTVATAELKAIQGKFMLINACA